MVNFALLCKFIQIELQRPYWIKSQNDLTCINYRCSVIIVPGFFDFCRTRAEQPLITYMHLSYLNGQFYTFRPIYANIAMAAILDQITKLFDMYQLQVLCYYYTRFNSFLPNQSWETFDHTHACPTPKYTVLNVYANLCKLSHSGHVGLNHKIIWSASITGAVLLFRQVSLISARPELRNPWPHTYISHT